MNLSDRSRKTVWHPYTQMKTAPAPVAIQRGEGAYLFDENGKRYIDAISSWWVNLHGHAHPLIAQKVSAQLEKLEQVIFAGFTHEPAVQLAENLLKILPGNPSRIFFSDNGSTAVEAAIKMAIQYWSNQGRKKSKIIAFEHSYHGDTFGAMSLSGRSVFTDHFSDFLFEVYHIPLPAKGKEEHSLEHLMKLAEQHPENIAAFIFEPLVLGAGGMLMYEPAALDKLISFCRQNGILCIADEVMTGFGRTGKNFACEYLTAFPDIICLSKGITGGTMPLAVTSCTGDVYDAFFSDNRLKTFFHGHSYTANPLACTAALASLELLLMGDCNDRINRIALQHRAFVEKHLLAGIFQNTRSTGTILAMDVIHNEPGGYMHPLRDRLYTYFLEKGILIRPLGNTLYLMPPYCTSAADLDYIYSVLEEAGRKFRSV